MQRKPRQPQPSKNLTEGATYRELLAVMLSRIEAGKADTNRDGRIDADEAVNLLAGSMNKEKLTNETYACWDTRYPYRKLEEVYDKEIFGKLRAKLQQTDIRFDEHPSGMDICHAIFRKALERFPPKQLRVAQERN